MFTYVYLKGLSQFFIQFSIKEKQILIQFCLIYEFVQLPFFQDNSMTSDIAEPTFLKYNPRVDDNVNVLDDNEEQLIEKYFKPCYHARVITFAETCPKYREKKLFEMLRYASQNTSLKDVMKQNYERHIQGEKPGIDTAFTSNGVFGLSFSSSSVTGKRSSRKVDPNRFSSRGIKDNAIFGHPLMAAVYNTQPTSNHMPNYFASQGSSQGRSIQTPANPNRKLPGSSDSVHLIVTKMIRPEYCQSLIAISPEYQNIWIELSKIINSRGSLRRTYAGVGLSKSQAFLDLSPSPYINRTKSPRGFNPENENLSISKTRSSDIEVQQPEGDSIRSPRRFNFSLRLNDPSIRQLYHSDNRWSPRVTIPKTE